MRSYEYDFALNYHKILDLSINMCLKCWAKVGFLLAWQRAKARPGWYMYMKFVLVFWTSRHTNYIITTVLYAGLSDFVTQTTISPGHSSVWLDLRDGSQLDTNQLVEAESSCWFNAVCLGQSVGEEEILSIHFSLNESEINRSCIKKVGPGHW